ncbi:hypothetical protein [Bacillus phage phiAGATE]|uniref:Uncharacterized protein n=1 Tax=Bacillus phage phiAGATE TaxID=1204533 RepID=L0LC88_9CAUD|nr:hypothetical protein G380_gp061 [Bacillus phage phiAGATE]AGB62711.1 hypothetical protein [Bacillus phage phiAGATE]
MPKYKVDVSFLTKELLINGEVATGDVLIAVMKQMECKKSSGSDTLSYYIKGIGELQFTPEKNMPQEKIKKLIRNGSGEWYPRNTNEA